MASVQGKFRHFRWPVLEAEDAAEFDARDAFEQAEQFLFGYLTEDDHHVALLLVGGINAVPLYLTPELIVAERLEPLLHVLHPFENHHGTSMPGRAPGMQVCLAERGLPWL